MTSSRKPSKKRSAGGESIPHPPDKLFLGNVLDLDSEKQIQDMMRLAREYGEIFYLNIAGRRVVVISSHELVNEVCDESRFDKRVWAPLKHLRPLAGDGLFTAHTFEPNWKKAHNILLPSFSMAAMKKYHPLMLDIARQMLDRWSRLNPAEEVDVSDQMTRLTLDTIGLCGFDYRFNSFYKERMHPFIRAMTRAMSIAMDRSARPAIPNELFFRESKRFERAVDLMSKTVDEIIQERRRIGVDLTRQNDLLSHMLVGRDRETGEGLDDLNIRYQIITFLIAGHETTSGLLSFATYYLLNNKEVRDRCYEEVDRVLGADLRRDPTYRQVTELKYIRQVLNESLRLWPTAPAFALFPLEGETTIGGRYEISQRDGLVVLTPMLHRDTSVWGDDAESFNPEHFSPEREAAVPVNAFKPFGNGQRACIGRQFAMHEATLALGMILQRFQLIDHLKYELDVKETLTLKPNDFSIRLAPRADRERAVARDAVTASPDVEPVPESGALALVRDEEVMALDQHGTPLLVLYGSNMGTAEGLARRLAEAGERRGFAATLAPLDEWVGRLPTEGLVTIISASYNGTPPDNAAQFCRWLESDELAEDALAGVSYTVFGCGHRDWAATYQEVPKKIDQLMAAKGAKRVLPRGEGDGGADFDGDFEEWYRPFWPTVIEQFELDLDPEALKAASRGIVYDVEVIDEQHPNPFVAAFGAKPMVVTSNRELQQSGSGRSTRHIELALPPGASYETGDHLGVISHNDEALVHRVAQRFLFDEQTRIRIHNRGAGHSEFPIGQAISVYQLLRDYVELQDVATRSQIKIMVEHTQCPHSRKALLELIGEDDGGGAAEKVYRQAVLEKRKSLIDLLEEFHACEMPFSVYLSLLQPLRPRYYSISSSDKVLDHICSLTVGVVSEPARSGHGIYKGTCSNYLAQKEKGSVVYAFVRNHGSSFRLPSSVSTPIIMVGPGTGIAPFRGFLQERAFLKEKGRPIGESMLFFGCRHPEQDFLYQEELEDYVAKGVTRLFCAFSRQDPSQKVYVQDRLREYSDDVWRLLEQGAVIYVCGDATNMAPAVRTAFAQIHRQHTNASQEATDQWLDQLVEQNRYLVDVWASS